MEVEIPYTAALASLHGREVEASRCLSLGLMRDTCDLVVHGSRHVSILSPCFFLFFYSQHEHETVLRLYHFVSCLLFPSIFLVRL